MLKFLNHHNQELIPSKQRYLIFENSLNLFTYINLFKEKKHDYFNRRKKIMKFKIGTW